MSHATQLHNRRYLDDYLKIINRAGLPHDVKAEVCQQVQHAVMTTVKGTIEEALEEELTAYLGCARYAYLPQGRLPEHTRNGFYTRALLTQYAAIADLRVPKLRRGNGQLHWQTIARYERCWGPLLDQHILGYCLGLSLRDLQETMPRTLGEGLSLEACDRVVLSLAQRVQTFQAARLTEPPPVVLVDGMWVKLAYPTGDVQVDAQGRRRATKRKQKRVVLTALGVWPDGHWEILHWQIAEHEDAKAWDRCFGALYAKGVTEETTQLVVSDGAAGLEQALDLHLSGVRQQRCIVHKVKNLTDHLQYLDLAPDPTLPPAEAARKAKRARRKAIVAEAAHIYASDVKAEIDARAPAFRATWEAREPTAVSNFFTDYSFALFTDPTL